MKRSRILTKSMLMLHLRNRATLFWNLIFPVLLLVIYAVVFGSGQVGDQDYMTWVVPGVIVFNILAYGLMGSAALMVQMRENGVLRRLQASPVPAAQLLGSYLAVNLIIGLLQSALILLFSLLVFHNPLTLQKALGAFPMLLVGILTFLSLGQVISGVATTAGAAVAVGQIINFGMMFITDLVMPLQLMPDWIQKLAPYLPAYAVVQLVRPPLMEGVYSPDLGKNLLVAAVYILVAGLVASRMFRWAPRS
jgi:ABC-2 type transport system permease protein